MQVDLGSLGFEEGGHLLGRRSLRQVAVNHEIEVTGTAPELELHLSTWCRAEGHRFRWDRDHGAARAVIIRGPAETDRWTGAERAGKPNPSHSDAVLDHPPRHWGLAARGSEVEAGTPEFDFR